MASEAELRTGGGGRPRGRTTSGAAAVAAGILLSRLAGFVRERAIGHFFGVGAHADVLRAAFRAPNALQVLLGEGTLSASFIPGYSRMLSEGREEDARRLAGAVFGLLAAVTALAVVVGVLFARPLVALTAPGFLAPAGGVDRFELTVRAVRILFPMTGLLVLSAWALGVLNSHRRFFLGYVAPVLWNAAILVALLVAGLRGQPLDDLLVATCWGALAGGALQLLVQVPLVLRLLGGLRPAVSLAVPGVRDVLRAFGPLVAGRGAVQLSGYLDQILASILAVGAVAALGPAQFLYLLPVSLFGLSVAAAELPELAREGARDRSALTARVTGGLGQVAFLVVPTAFGYLAFGTLVVGAVYRTGRFGEEQTWLVAAVLFAYSLGLVASTASRVMQSSFYALHDTKTPARIAASRVLLSAVLAVPLMLALDRFAVADVLALEVPAAGLRFGAVGLALAASVAAWLELGLLTRALRRRLPEFRLPVARWGKMMTVAVLAGGVATLVAWVLPRTWPIWLRAVPVLGVFAALYLAVAPRLGINEAARWYGRLFGAAKKPTSRNGADAPPSENPTER